MDGYAGFLQNENIKNNINEIIKLISETIYNDIKKLDKFELFKNIMFTEGIIPLKTMCERVGVYLDYLFLQHLFGVNYFSELIFDVEAIQQTI